MLIDVPDGDLTKEELGRLDSLLSSARGFHYTSFTIAGISLVLSSFESTGFQLPIGDIEIPKLQTTIGLYFLVLILSICAEKLFYMALPWLKVDKRRIPFAWIALSSRKSSLVPYFIFWLVIPPIVAGISTAASLDDPNLPGFVLCFLGLFFIVAPMNIEREIYCIKNRVDSRGRPVTLTKWIYYWEKLLGSIAMTFFYFSVVLVLLPKWYEILSQPAKVFVVVWLLSMLLRFISSFKIVSRRIDRYGKSIGFRVEESRL